MEHQQETEEKPQPEVRKENFPYMFSEVEMHEILQAAVHQPYNSANLLDLLLNGKKKRG
ncbi:MAG: hypothetical protein LBE71_06290 [Dysgonamonadaceae bacterium]|nr:hypothetical protein [Dysgonamonadaceae bacterium]